MSNRSRNTRRSQNKGRSAIVTMGDGTQIPVAIDHIKEWNVAHGVASCGTQVNSLRFQQYGNTTIVNDAGRISAHNTAELEVLGAKLFGEAIRDGRVTTSA